MKKLQNTLYVTSENSYLSLEGENVVISMDDEQKRLPLHLLDSIMYFGYKGASPALMGACCERNIRLAFMKPSGRFLAACSSETNGNVLLRKAQYRISENEKESMKIGRNIIVGKLHNSRCVLERAVRDHSERIDVQKVKAASDYIQSSLRSCLAADSADTLRGIEGVCSKAYFEVFDDMILRSKEAFFYKGRSRRPPLDNVNALLSFCYTLLANECAGALTAVGLDPFVGFIHADRPGRKSLALDIMEELRSPFADRFVITLINNREVTANCFTKKENGAVMMSDEFRRSLINSWQNKKKETITHPYLNEKIEWGLVPFAQAMLLARHIRGDLDEYPPFMWK